MSPLQQQRLEALKAALDDAINTPLSPREALEVLEEHEGDVEAWKDALREDINRKDEP